MNILRYALKNIFRNFFLSATSVLIIGLLVFFVNILLFVLYSAEQFIESVNNRISITINFRDEVTTDTPRSKALIDGLKTAFTGVMVDYISREKAFEILKVRNPDLANLLEGTEENPLPNSLRVSNIDLGSYDALNTTIATYQDILQYDQTDMTKKLLDYKTQYDRIAVVVHVLRMLQYGVYVLLGLFVFTVFAIVHMIIRNFIFFLRDEVRIIELVGGKPSFIYGPFVIQGFLYTTMATVFSIGALYLGNAAISVDFVSGPLAHVVTGFYETLWNWFSLELLGFGSIGILSAFIASRSYIHSTIGE